MAHIQYTICRSGMYYYNKRVPIHAVKTYGPFIRNSSRPTQLAWTLLLSHTQ